MTARKPIAVATNDSPQSQAAVLWAARRAGRAGLPLAKYFGKASIMLVGQGTGHLGGSPADRPLQVAAACRVPVAVVGTQDTSGRSGELGPVEALVGAAANARMLVVGSRGRGASKRILLGSTPHGVLKHLPCPRVITRIQAAKNKNKRRIRHRPSRPYLLLSGLAS